MPAAQSKQTGKSMIDPTPNGDSQQQNGQLGKKAKKWATEKGAGMRLLKTCYIGK